MIEQKVQHDSCRMRGRNQEGDWDDCALKDGRGVVLHESCGIVWDGSYLEVGGGVEEVGNCNPIIEGSSTLRSSFRVSVMNKNRHLCWIEG